MNPNIIQRALKREGLSPPVISSVIASVEHAEDAIVKKQSRPAWERVHEPLRRSIRGLQSSFSRWKDDPCRAPVYSRYLKLMLHVRDQLYALEAANPGARIQDVAKTHNLVANGLYWPDWVPPEKKRVVLRAFEYLYNTALPEAKGKVPHHASGKRIVPFSTKAKVSASDRRWERMYKACTDQHATLKGNPRAPGNPADAPAVDALAYAIGVMEHRGPQDVAPAQWLALVTPELRAAYKEWKYTLTASHQTGEGTSVPVLSAEQHAQASRAAYQQLDADLALKREKQRAYAEAYRDRQAVKRQEARSRGARQRMVDNGLPVAQKMTRLATAEKSSAASDDNPFEGM
jgi:hypothetical protein